ncbi:MAG: PQQ-binding-like beta-propeller repeat protein [Planctomycetota bacterium]
MKPKPVFLSCFLLFSTVAFSPFAGGVEKAPDLVRESGIAGGLVVHVGCAGGQFTADLRVNRRYLVQGLEPDAARAREARASLRNRGESGGVTVIHWDGKWLPYADNMVNLMIVDSPEGLAAEEILRALAPGGVALVKSGDGRRKLEKPWPEEIDKWTRFLHGPDNNAVAEDTRVEPPRYMQWVSGPRWGRSHDHLSSVSAVVSAAGRIFSIVDEGPIASVKAESKWMLVARDAFNGVLLWKKPVTPWENQLRPFRSGPAELPRRLVAVGDRVYVTLGYDQPVTAIDAATGDVVRTYDGTENTHEIVCHEGTLYLVVSEPLEAKSPTTGKVLKHFPVWRDSYLEYNTQYMPKHVRAVEAASGKLLWKKADGEVANILPLTLITSGGRVFFQNEEHLVALKADLGDVLWKADRPSVRHRYAWLTPTLVVSDGVLLSADRRADMPVDIESDDQTALQWRVSANHVLTDGEILAFSAEDGKRLWTAPCHEGFNSPVDVFVINGRVYSGTLAWGKQPGITKVYDLHTGEVVATRKADQEHYTLGFGHHRCHRNKATTKYVIQGRAGVEFLDVEDPDHVTADHWVRGACQYGTLPSNGLIYAPTHPCACYVTAKLSGYNALSGQRATEPREEPERLEKGPAFGVMNDLESESDDAWPTFRHDHARSGSTDVALPPALKQDWERTIPGPLTAVVVADGRLYVAEREAHTVHALKADDGSPLWSSTVGGRVDSPPTVHGGQVYFGSADGWIYCLRARDGALAWRFRVAPESRQIVSYGQLESVWPVHGTVLVCAPGGGRPVVYASAGRSSYVDGGVYLTGVDAETGELVTRRRISHRDPKTGLEPQNLIRGVSMPGAIPDVLATDGASIFMRHQRFDFSGESLEPNVDHLFCSAGYLDDTWWHRTYLQIGRSMSGGYGGWTNAGNTQISGKALVSDGSRAFGFGRKEYTMTGSHLGLQSECHLFAAEVKRNATPKGRKPTRGVDYLWSTSIPFYPRAMLLAGDTLFFAGPQSVDDFDAREPKSDVLLWAVSTDDGSRKAEYRLKASPVYDSFAASAGRLHFTTVDGHVVCYTGQ